MISFEGRQAQELRFSQAKIDELGTLKQEEEALVIALAREENLLGMVQDAAEGMAKRDRLLAKLRGLRGEVAEPVSAETPLDRSSYQSAKDRLDAKRAEIGEREAELRTRFGLT